jgi:SAM-dependent methyltransferase
MTDVVEDDEGEPSDVADSALIAPSDHERAYISAMSRPGVVHAYEAWLSLSEGESLCLTRHVPAGGRILDLGCGAGRVAHHLAQHAGVYVGVDASAEMVAAAKRRLPGVDFRESNILDLTFVQSSFDAILLMHNVIDNLHPHHRRTALLRRCRDWLSDGGGLICSSHLLGNRDSAGYYSEDYHGSEVTNYRSSLPEFIREIETAGFEVLIAVRDFRGATADWAYTASRPTPKA